MPPKSDGPRIPPKLKEVLSPFGTTTFPPFTYSLAFPLRSLRSLRLSLSRAHNIPIRADERMAACPAHPLAIAFDSAEKLAAC